MCRWYVKQNYCRVFADRCLEFSGPVILLATQYIQSVDIHNFFVYAYGRSSALPQNLLATNVSLVRLRGMELTQFTHAHMACMRKFFLLRSCSWHDLLIRFHR